MLMRPKNPLVGLSRQQKIAFGVIGGFVLAAGTLTTLAWAAKSDPDRPKPTIEVGPGCATFAITSQQQLGDELRLAVRAAAKKGSVDPFRVTSLYLKRAVPRCRTYPARTETTGEAKLFATIFIELLNVMQQEGFLSEADTPVWYAMMTTWAVGQGVPEEEL